MYNPKNLSKMLKINKQPIEYKIQLNTTPEVNVSWRSYDEMPKVLKEALRNDEDLQKDFAALVACIKHIDKPNADLIYDSANMLYAIESLLGYFGVGTMCEIFDFLRGWF